MKPDRKITVKRSVVLIWNQTKVQCWVQNNFRPLRAPLLFEINKMSICHVSQNRLLSSLPPKVIEGFLPHLELQTLVTGDILYESGSNRDQTYFPINCVISVVRGTQDGSTAKIAMIGNEGFVGIASFMGGDYSPSRVLVQNGGLSYRLRGQKVRDEFNNSGGCLQLMLRYTQARLTQISLTVACNRHHAISQQLCRWLLETLDRVPGDEIRATQEHVATLLGVRREGVTSAAGKLQSLGAITYGRGKIVILDRSILESLSCECYQVIKNEFDRLMPFVAPTSMSVKGTMFPAMASAKQRSVAKASA